MEWYRVVKTIRGRRYIYLQRTRREGGKVKTESKYVGPAHHADVAYPWKSVGKKPDGSVILQAVIPKERLYNKHGFHRTYTYQGVRYHGTVPTKVVTEKDNPEIVNLWDTPAIKVMGIRQILQTDDYSKDEDLAWSLSNKYRLDWGEARWWVAQRDWYMKHIVLDDGSIYDPKEGIAVDPLTGERKPFKLPHDPSLPLNPSE
jgi:hypothetical protein